VKAALIARIEGIRRRNIESVRRIVDEAHYTKFDDWPPFERQGLEALKREEEAYRVLRDFNYEISDWRIDVFNDAAIASFIIKYSGQIRNRKFYIRSRVSAFMVKMGEEWKLIHEHWSRIPEFF